MNGTATPNMFDRLALAFGRATKAAPNPGAFYPAQGYLGAVPTYPQSWPGWPDRKADDLLSLQGDLQRAQVAVANSWVFSAIAAIAAEFSAAELTVTIQTNDGDEEETDTHPLEDLWQHPNVFMSQSFVAQYWVWQLLLFGEAYLYLAPGAGTVKELWPVPSVAMQPIPDPQRFIKAYRFQANADQHPIDIDARYICYSRLPHPFDPHRGLSPIAAIWLGIATDTLMAKWNANFFGKENAVPTAAISTKPEMQPQDFARFRQELFDFFGSGQRRVFVGRGGDIDVKMLAFNPEQMQFSQLREMSRNEIDRVFGIPGGYWDAGANRANAEHAAQALIRTAVWPKLVMLGQDLTAQILPFWWPDEDTTVGFEDIRGDDRQQDLAEFTALQTVLLVNELRERYKYPPLPEDDVRGQMLVAEIAKGAATPGSPVEDILNEKMDAMEAAAGPPMEPDDGSQPAPAEPAAEAAPEEATPDDQAALETGAEAPVLASKALELERWQSKALKALKAGRAPLVAFESDAIDEATKAIVVAALSGAVTRQEVCRAFDAAGFRR